MGTVILSFGASLGVCALVFEHIFGFAGADAGFPLFVFLVALGIDYNIFLMTRVREESLRYGTRLGALIGLASTGGVITSAGLVLVGTFSAMMTMPMLFLVEIGFCGRLRGPPRHDHRQVCARDGAEPRPRRHMWWPSALGKKEDVEPEHSADEATLVR